MLINALIFTFKQNPEDKTHFIFLGSFLQEHDLGLIQSPSLSSWELDRFGLEPKVKQKEQFLHSTEATKPAFAEGHKKVTLKSNFLTPGERVRPRKKTFIPGLEPEAAFYPSLKLKLP